jgi:signal transduction histidine kinase
MPFRILALASRTAEPEILMKRLSARTLLYVAIDVVFLIACFYQVQYLLGRPGIPFVLNERGKVIVVDRLVNQPASGSLTPGDTVLAFEGVSIESPYDADFLADYRSIGDKVAVSLYHDGVVRTTYVDLVPFFRTRYAIVSLLVGILTWVLGVFVLVVRPRERTAAVLHAALVSLAFSVMCMWGATPRGDPWVLISRSMYFVMYMGAAAHFLFFTTLFPRPIVPVTVRRIILLYAPGAIVASIAMAVHLYAVWFSSLEEYRGFRVLFHLFHAMILPYVGLGIWNFIRSYRATSLPEEKKKLQWLLWGLVVGPAPFLLLEVLPELFIPLSPVPEEYTLVFFLLIPISFAVSFVRYHLLDVQVVINRTTVYGIVLTVLMLIYVGMVGMASYLAGSYSLESSTGAAVLIALAFEPLRRKVQHVVDTRFFRVRYDFRLAQRKFAEEMKNQPDTSTLARFLVEQIQRLMPMQTAAFCTIPEDGREFHVLEELPQRHLEDYPDFLQQARAWAASYRPVALTDMIEAGVSHEAADRVGFARWGLVAVFPMHAKGGSLLGVLAIGVKRSGARFSSEDIDLIANVATQAGLEVERINLQQELLRKVAEAHREKELNELKSEFVSYVSHEFRTPLTSIKMFAELLGNRARGRDGKSKEFLQIIEGEADRLDRMVTTILDSSKIEKGIKQYHFSEADLGDLARNVLHCMEYQLKKEGFTVQTVGLAPSRRYPVRVDRDAVIEALINLMANAIKYSDKRKQIKLILAEDNSWVRCSVVDRGRGIPAEALPHVFEKYYRVPSAGFEIEGVGLGLPLVKSIVEAHGGRIEVESTPEGGSRFHLLFPRLAQGKRAPRKRRSRSRA